MVKVRLHSILCMCVYAYFTSMLPLFGLNNILRVLNPCDFYFGHIHENMLINVKLDHEFMRYPAAALKHAVLAKLPDLF